VADGVQDVVHALGIDAHFHADAEQLARSLSDSLLELYSAIDRIGALDEKVTRRFRNGVLPEWTRAVGENIHGAASALLETLSDLRQLILEKAALEPRLAPKLLSEQGFFLTKLEAMVQTWDVLLEEDIAGQPPTARWLERHENSSGQTDFMICGSPITAAGMLDQLLWRRAAACALTSATITSCGSFSLFLRESGLDRMPESTLLELDSPFDYARQAELVVPRMRSDPRCPPEHTAEIVEVLPELVASGGALILFSSARQMRDVFGMIPESLRADVLMQGSMPKHAILQKHRERIAAGQRSVIFGLAATWGEGVDLPGELCTHVVLARLAFKRPNSPLEEARHEWVESQGRSAFLEICVPEVGIRLAQSVGRLIRTHTDTGRITVLDRRLGASRWGRQLLRGLPPFTIRLFPPPERARGLKRETSPVL
jgi:ATP-dependent DNA helicase DinG